MDSEFAAIKEKERLKILEQQILDMLLSHTTDHRYIIRELDYTYDCKGSSHDNIAVIEILCKIKDTNQNLNDNDKKAAKGTKSLLHRVLAKPLCYRIEDMVVLKP